MVNILNNLNANNALIMLAKSDVNVQASARNIEKVKTTLVSTMNIYDLLKYNKLIVTVDAIKALEEVYA